MIVDPEVVRMMQERPATRVWLTLAPAGDVESFDDLTRRAGLEALGRGWTIVDEARARRFLIGLLHRDLAYKHDVMPQRRAEWLAEQFLTAAVGTGLASRRTAPTCLMSSPSRGNRRRTTPSMPALP